MKTVLFVMSQTIL